jgi:acyl-CoA synthetase (AMP-forming)/AMP-acid ligase II
MSLRVNLLEAFAFSDSASVGGRVALRLRIGPRSRHRDVTFSELREAVREHAARFVAMGARPGERVALLMPHTERVVATFLGAIWCGLIPSIIAWPTAKMDSEKYSRNVRAVLRSLRADWLVTDKPNADALRAVLDTTRVLDCDESSGDHPPPPPQLRTEGMAFIQFSGGTTGTQKSVPISFAHLERQLLSLRDALRLTDDDHVISWLPLYHDMGLIACLLMPFVLRLPLTMFAPMEWVMDPRPFLAEIGRSSATLCWLPNFAFSFMALRAPTIGEALDLSSMRAFVNCSEPVRAESFDAFRRAFEKHGLRDATLHASYAMAEATFAVTQSRDTDPPRRLNVSASEYAAGRLVPAAGRTLVSCGAPVSGVDIRVVDISGTDVPEGHVGEIWLRGAFLMEGYLDAPRSSDSTFTAGWYRTGDLGALREGHLFVTGRKKDVIIVGGVNVYPEDLESAVGSLPGIHAGRVVAFGLESPELGTERLFVIAEADDDATLQRSEEIELDIRKTVVAVAAVAPHVVHVVPPRWIVKSTAGKISRPETKAKFLAGDLSHQPEARRERSESS